MRKESLEFLRKLMETPSPSGFEERVQEVVARYMRQYCDEVKTDVHGNCIGVKNPDKRFRVMLAGHCDEVGMMVKHITPEGYIYFANIGGVDASLVPSQRVLIHGKKGATRGVVGKKAIHLMEAEEKKKVPKLHELWIDIGAESREDALKVISIGDPITFDAPFTPLLGDLAAGHGFDDKVGSFVVAETMRLLARKKVSVGVYGVSTVQEELGLRGAQTSAFGIDPQVGIAVDVGFASDYPDANKKQLGEVKVGSGPILHKGANINRVLGELVFDVARKKRIPYQVSGEPGRTGTDAAAIQVTRAGVATALVSIPNRYMHTTVEVVSLADLENAARLLTFTIEGLSPRMDFRP
ncbi:MAG: hydrolase [Planctomycetes bacterium DG_23]|nr:MAG: hydrolase [Planctomycetes bacterium DG_23]